MKFPLTPEMMSRHELAAQNFYRQVSSKAMDKFLKKEVRTLIRSGVAVTVLGNTIRQELRTAISEIREDKLDFVKQKIGVWVKQALLREISPGKDSQKADNEIDRLVMSFLNEFDVAYQVQKVIIGAKQDQEKENSNNVMPIKEDN